METIKILTTLSDKDTTKFRGKRMKNKNLYVIHKGNVVEESKNIVDYLLKRTGLDQFIDALIQLLKAILEQITSSEQIKDLLRFLDVLTGRLQIMFGSLFI